MKAIIFDIDDTLYDQIEPFEHAYKTVFGDQYQISIQELFVSSRKHSDVVFKSTQTGHMTMRDMYIYRIRNAFLDYKIEITEQQALDFQEHYSWQQKNITMTKTMKDILVYCKNNKIQLGIITNGPSAHQREKIKSLNLGDYIKQDYMFISGDYDFAKPDIQMFEYAEKVMQIEKKDLIYIGDAYENDVVGAKQAGWNCIWFNRRGHVQPDVEYKPDFIVGDEEELFQIINSIQKIL